MALSLRSFVRKGGSGELQVSWFTVPVVYVKKIGFRWLRPRPRPRPRKPNTNGDGSHTHFAFGSAPRLLIGRTASAYPRDDAMHHAV